MWIIPFSRVNSSCCQPFGPCPPCKTFDPFSSWAFFCHGLGSFSAFYELTTLWQRITCTIRSSPKIHSIKKHYFTLSYQQVPHQKASTVDFSRGRISAPYTAYWHDSIRVHLMRAFRPFIRVLRPLIYFLPDGPLCLIELNETESHVQLVPGFQPLIRLFRPLEQDT